MLCLTLSFRSEFIMLEIIRKIISRLFAKDNYLEYIGGVDVLPPPLSFEEEEKYLNKMQFGDEYAKKYIIEHNLRLVVYIEYQLGQSDS